ncbi:MAG TPA: lytic transglycosylase domain-containing protein, partial [Rhodocyclaceae bacterium]|nr:lytic transglycosylase domain-containing protein [Rhodocyclaceae bacterium]
MADKPFSREVEVFSREAKVDPALVHAIIHVESRHRQNAVSPKGALGLMQVMPATAQRYGVRTAAKSADENLKAGTRYLKDLMDMFDGKLDLVLAAYNAGEGAVMRYKAIPPYKETRAYVPAVLAKYEE